MTMPAKNPTWNIEQLSYNLLIYAYHLEHGPYGFFFYSGDRDEPPHVHVERERNKAKFWLDPVRLQNSGGYNRNEINRIQRLIEESRKILLEKWHDYFSD